MKKYLYSFLLLTAFRSQLKSMDEGYWLGGGQEELNQIEAGQEDDLLANWEKNYADALNNQNSQDAINALGVFLNNNDQLVQEIENWARYNDQSPLVWAVNANMPDVVTFIIEHDNFMQIEFAMECIRKALEIAQQQENQNQEIIDILQEVVQE
jgi:hypothetical protein